MLEDRSLLRVRTGRAADASALAEIFRKSWKLAYTGVIPHLHLDGMIQRRGVDWWRASLAASDTTLVLDLGGKPIGYATFGASRGRIVSQGEIYELYLDPGHQGLGFGEHLFEACRNRLDQRKLKGLVVWALIDNTAACSFYWRRGGRPVTSTFDRIGGARLERVAFTWP